jgi:hypothetical protein
MALSAYELAGESLCSSITAKRVKKLLHNIGFQSDRIKFDAQNGVAVRATIAHAIPTVST